MGGSGQQLYLFGDDPRGATVSAFVSLGHSPGTVPCLYLALAVLVKAFGQY